jgi:KaiC/GvpD/RAD55 family RecA-like ATPase
MTEVAVTRTPESSTEERAQTGLPELDGMLEGGFLRGSLITLSGRPGTGKTIFGSHFLYHGAKKTKQAGMYVSMLESEKSYLHNARRIGLDFEPLMAQKKFAFLELPAPTAEGLPSLWEQIAREIEENETERLVIDSFTAMSPAFQTVGDLRTFTHVLLGKLVGGASGCTTLLITEEGTGGGLPFTGGGLPFTGVEEFVADGVIKFSIVPAGEARVRYIEITKMRGTNHQMGPIPIDIGLRGIRIVHPHVRGKVG